MGFYFPCNRQRLNPNDRVESGIRRTIDRFSGVRAMPTKLDYDFNHSVARIDLSAERSGVFTPDIAMIDINEGALQRFNEVTALVAPGVKPMSGDQVAGACRRVLRASNKGAQSPFIRVRLRRAAEMRAALADPDWPMEASVHQRVAALVGYMDDPHGLISNDLPVIGRLDEALLVDAAMENLRAELEDYADFCRYRHGEAMRLGVAPESAGIDRAQWNEEREQERRLEQQLRHVRASNYTAGTMEHAFRVC
jgi:hypothetical protein